MHRHDLLNEKLQRRGWVHLSPIVPPELQGRPAVLDLPEDIRKQEGNPYRAAEPRPRRKQMSPVLGEQQGDEDPEPEGQYAELGQQPQARYEAEQKPEAGLISLEYQH